MKVVVVDYGVSNLLSVGRAFERCGATVTLASEAATIEHADRLVLPGVGAFADCMSGFASRGFVEPVLRFIESGRPFLGICVGMQILFERSEEFGDHPGMGLFGGAVRMIPRTGSDGRPHKIPHIGWAPLELPDGRGPSFWRGTVLDGLAPGTAMYFVHSFTADPADPAVRLADCRYDGRLVSAAIARDNVTATQFHPEKSGPAGLALLSGFLAR